jgi:hypothetical protein
LEEVIPGDPRTTRVLGLSRAGQFSVIHPERFAEKGVGLTTIRASEARAPESSRLDLSPYEGRLIMVEGVDHGGWLYEARVIDQAGPIMSAVIRELFGARARRPQ